MLTVVYCLALGHQCKKMPVVMVQRSSTDKESMKEHVKVFRLCM